MYKCREIWNELDIDSRKLFLEIEIMQVKNILKKRRVLNYEPTIFDQYKWRDLSLE